MSTAHRDGIAKFLKADLTAKSQAWGLGAKKPVVTKAVKATKPVKVAVSLPKLAKSKPKA